MYVCVRVNVCVYRACPEFVLYYAHIAAFEPVHNGEWELQDLRLWFWRRVCLYNVRCTPFCLPLFYFPIVCVSIDPFILNFFPMYFIYEYFLRDKCDLTVWNVDYPTSILITLPPSSQHPSLGCKSLASKQKTFEILFNHVL